MSTDPGLNRRRYRFIHDQITECPPLRETALGVTKADGAVREYLSGVPDYLNRLAGIRQESTESCPFCSFELALDPAAYQTADDTEPFLSTAEIHESLWNRGLILTYNPSGWHLINELVIPRRHLSNKSIINTEVAECLAVVQRRWCRHKSGIETLEGVPQQLGLYHGGVINLRAGQSVAHGHFHCYTSIHDRRTYPAAREAVSSRTTDTGEVSVSLVPFNLPRIVMHVCDNDRDDSTVSAFGEAFATACVKTFTDLCGSAPPASIGWFHESGTDRYAMVYHPIQRGGSIEQFHRGTFHKFDSSELVDVIGPKISKYLHLPER